MKLSQEIRMKYLTGFVSGCLFGIGIMSLSLINLLSGYISGEQILSITYLGFAAIVAGIVSAALICRQFTKLYSVLRTDKRQWSDSFNERTGYLLRV